MKRTVQLKKAGVPDPRQGRAPTTPRRDWRRGEVVNHFDKPLNVAAAAFLREGSEGAIRVLGSKSKFVELSPRIKARINAWMRAAKRMEELT